MQRAPRSRLRYLFSPPDREAAPDGFADYESGKRRRYDLLFAVNGGAFAVGTWLLKGEAGPAIRFGGLEQAHFGLGMAGFAAIMCLDLFAFGLKYRQFFGLPGKLVVLGLSTLLMTAWLLAGKVQDDLAVLPVLSGALWAMLAALVAAIGMASVACLSLPPPSQGSR
jgi:hypothetical protein